MPEDGDNMCRHPAVAQGVPAQDLRRAAGGPRDGDLPARGGGDHARHGQGRRCMPDSCHFALAYTGSLLTLQSGHIENSHYGQPCDAVALDPVVMVRG